MDASALSRFKRDQALYTFYANKKANQKEQPDIQTNSTVNDRIVGSLDFIMPQTTPVLALDELIVQILLDQLTYTAAKNFGPTRSSRLNYIFMFTVAAAYNWVSPILTGTKDSWNWDTHYKTGTDNDTYIFVNHALITVLPTLIPGYDIRPLLVNEQALMGWTPSSQTAYVTALQTSLNFSTWLSNWQTWYASRQNDGNVAASVPAAAAVLPNGTMFLNVDYTQDISTYTSPTQWTPLVIKNRTQQKYMTLNWNDVRSTCLTSDNEIAVKAAAAPEYPDTTAERDADITELLNIVEHLDDSEKVQAEFWAGGPFTVSPPGMFVYMWGMVTLSSKFAETNGMNSFILSGLQLCVSLFEVGRLVWGIKKQYMQARPIQDVRIRYSGQTLTSYAGTPIDGSLWVPFQTATFVTPPFADFPSGHSAFGKAFVDVMTSWYGAAVPQTKPITLTKMFLLSPIFTTDQVQPPGVFVFPQGKSEIQPGVVPASDFTIRFTTWAEISASCGFSRQCGGIHARSAHLGSVAMANAIMPFINTAWGF